MKLKQKQKIGQINMRCTTIKFITKLFKNPKLKVSFKAENTKGKLLAQNKNTSFNKCNKCDVNQLICQCCNKNILDTSKGLFI